MRLGYHCASYHFPDDDGPPFESVVSLARRLEAAGVDWFSVMDHLWQLPFVGRRDEPFFDAYTTLPAVARETSAMELAALVTCPHYRNPAVLGRLLATLDHVSGGRAVFGVGAGWFEEEYDAYGVPFPDAERRVHDLRDTVELVRAMWTEPSPLSVETPFHSVEDLYLEPKPVQSGGPDVLVGGGGEELTLQAVADVADRWNVPGVSPGEFARKREVLAGYCDRFGRDLGDLEATVLGTAVVRETTAAAHDAYERLRAETAAGDPPDRDEYRGFVGTPAEVGELLDAFADRGAAAVMLRAERNDPETLDYLVETVAPSVA